MSYIIRINQQNRRRRRCIIINHFRNIEHKETLITITLPHKYIILSHNCLIKLKGYLYPNLFQQCYKNKVNSDRENMGLEGATCRLLYLYIFLLLWSVLLVLLAYLLWDDLSCIVFALTNIALVLVATLSFLLVSLMIMWGWKHQHCW